MDSSSLVRTFFGACSTLVRLFSDSYKVGEMSEKSRTKADDAPKQFRRKPGDTLVNYLNLAPLHPLILTHARSLVTK
jgi:hypothetical protein